MNKRQRKKWLKQHNKYFDPRETWSLNWTIAKFVYPRLKKFKKENIGFPHEFKTIDEWNEILDKMLFSFKVLKEDCVGLEIDFNDPNWKNEIDKTNERIQEGLELFGKYFRDLWW